MSWLDIPAFAGVKVDGSRSVPVAAGSTSNWAPRTAKEAFAQMGRSIGSYRDKERWARGGQRVDFFEGVKEAEEEAPPSSGEQEKRTKH